MLWAYITIKQHCHHVHICKEASDVSDQSLLLSTEIGELVTRTGIQHISSMSMLSNAFPSLQQHVSECNRDENRVIYLTKHVAKCYGMTGSITLPRNIQKRWQSGLICKKKKNVKVNCIQERVMHLDHLSGWIIEMLLSPYDPLCHLLNLILAPWKCFMAICQFVHWLIMLNLRLQNTIMVMHS